MIENRWIIIAGEEAGPRSNKMGGIWNVIEAETVTLADLMNSGEIEEENMPNILVVGPYYGYSGADWNKSLNRITNMDNLKEFNPGEEIEDAIDAIKKEGIEVVTGSRKLGDIEIGYLMFNTDNFCRTTVEHNGTEISLENKIKAEAFETLFIDSMKYEDMGNGPEYTHYLNLSYAISEFIRALVTINEDKLKQYRDEAVSEFASSLMPKVEVSLHCHEFGVFYSAARLKKLNVPFRSVATYHATVPGRVSGHRSIQKIRNNDSKWDRGVPENMAKLESLSSFADVVTAVGDSTRKEVKLFYGIDSMTVRNGITLTGTDLDWDKKVEAREKIQKITSNSLHNLYDGGHLPPKQIIPLFSISRIEVENKGYPDLLDSLVLLDRMMNMEVKAGKRDENIRVVCFIVTAHGPKNNVPDGFPINLPEDVIEGEEIRIQRMIEERGLDSSNLPGGKRYVSAILYPQWISDHDGGLNMSPEEFMSGCIGGIFPSKYEPFLLTGLEAGKEYTPSIVSKVCGFSDALRTIKSLVMGIGGVIVVDNIDLPYNETIADYALAMDYLIDTYIEDKVKYKLLCQEAHLLAQKMNWTAPTKEYYELLTGTKVT